MVQRTTKTTSTIDLNQPIIANSDYIHSFSLDQLVVVCHPHFLGALFDLFLEATSFLGSYLLANAFLVLKGFLVTGRQS
jgi:hypothetical protein